MKRNVLFIIWLVGAILSIAASIAIIVVAIHFIQKYW